MEVTSFTGNAGPISGDPNAGQPVDKNRLMEFNEALNRYKAGKAKLERRIISSEQWWKLRNDSEEFLEGVQSGMGFKAKSGWLHNVLVSKHADAMANFPEPLILPREPGDKQEAQKLSSILPVLLEENDFEQTYSDAWWAKLKHGTAVYMVTWDQDKLNGLGDVSIRDVDLLSLFWEPGITDIQKSKYFFHCELRDNESLEHEYPQLQGKLGASYFTLSKYIYDDNVNTDGKSLVIDVYYKQDGAVHFCKYVNDEVLVSTENNAFGMPAMPPDIGAGFDMGGSMFGGGMDMPMQQNAPTAQNMSPAEPMPAPAPEMDYSMVEQPQFMPPVPAMSTGIYEDGLYPFVFDVLFPIEGSPCGYGYVDLCKNTQTQIDMMDTALLQNMMSSVTPRYFVRGDGSVNEKEFLDLTKPLIHVDGNLGEDSLKVVDHMQLGNHYLSMYSNKIAELRETSGNTETANGVSTQGVTSASGIAALQEASGKTSSDSAKASYRAFRRITTMVIERIRQFYDLPRQFRITGQFGQEQFVTYDNSNLQAQWQGGIGETDLGFKLPVFDIKIEVAKKNAYTRMSQNDLALQFYNLGFFNPQMSTMAVNCLEMMDFDGRDELMQRIQMTGTLFTQMQQLSQYVVALLQKYEPENAPAMAQTLGMQMQGQTRQGAIDQGMANDGFTDPEAENPIVERSRQKAQEAAAPE